MPLVDPVTMSSSIAKGGVAAARSSPAAVKGKTTTTFTSPTTAVAKLLPVQLQQTPASQYTRHAVPALLAALFVARFQSLVADPVATMYSSLPVVAALQMAYALACLPIAGAAGSVGAGAGARKPRPGDKKKIAGSGSSAGSGSGGDAAGRRPYPPVTAFLSLILTALATPFLFAAMVLFGAPLLTHPAHTLLCAAHLAVLALFPLFYVHGVDAAAWAAVAACQAPLDDTFGGLVGGLAGAWLGAVPIPLDWDRAWQRWPVTILAGLYAGYLLGRALGGSWLLWGKKF
ncbi:GPI biosynthesis protein family Pig-F-domain-containing protein [Lasiosphaeria miniovina]|uniref:GPI biosynthesis protein family Pig-F-domain-containing protein n=1 Tax=Lasiosphaeria miniovina TaxID=1954250 RepID=A0AA40B641_9PEZI|nr:GPI biosynthesis protein family Pig-F-domain-containing protein [Lasiosphaeria miniovina]KAK0728411.1 GPI biosynthesis protein family Pig-F-domain-containing protein [Lasiosphaeria miniovina]